MRTLLCFMVVAGCSEYGLTEQTRPGPAGQPDIEVAPADVDFGSVTLGDGQVTAGIEIRNVGRTPLTVARMELPGDAFTVLDVNTPFSLRAGEIRPVTIGFTPAHPGVNDAQLTVHSDDPDELRSFVELVGHGRGPWLRIDPPHHDFGSAQIPCSDSVDVVLQNVGDAELTVSGVDWAGDEQLSLTLHRAPPYVLAPGEYSEVTVTLEPHSPGAIDATVVVDSSDWRGPLAATQVATPFEVGQGSDTWTVPPDPPVDLVLAVDRSSSMEDDAVSLADSFETFVGAIGEVTDNWRLGVVTLDSGCFNGGVLTVATPDYIGAFRTAVTTGNDREIVDDEALFSLVDRALIQSGSSGCNAGFRRPDAALHVMVVSDEPERSADRVASLTWDTFVDRWTSYVRAPSLLKVSGVVDIDTCGEGADGYMQAIAATDGVALSICKGDWGESATELAKATLAQVYRFPLSQTPVPASLVVEVDGDPTDLWTYDEVVNEIVFADVAAGASIHARYILGSVCP
jgi:hypothetical protein